MAHLVSSADPWFINMLLVGLAAYFLWSIKGLFKDLKDSITDLKKLITDLYEHRNDHERRITAIETKCLWEHGEMGFTPQRLSGGRRPYDPKEVPGGHNENN